MSRSACSVACIVVALAACGHEPSTASAQRESPQDVAAAAEPTSEGSALPSAATVASAPAPSVADEADAEELCGAAHAKPYPVITDPSSAPSDPLAPKVLGEPRSGPDRVVASMARDFRRCYARGLACDEKMQGTVRIAASIEADGRVSSAKPVEASGLSRGVIDCLAAVVASKSFGQPEGGAAAIVVPISFARQE